MRVLTCPAGAEVGMTVSMRVMIARDGYKHLLRTVAAKDDDREPTP